MYFLLLNCDCYLKYTKLYLGFVMFYNQKHQFNKYGYENLLKKSNLLGKKKNFDMKNNETKNKSSQKLQIQEIEWKER